MGVKYLHDQGICHRDLNPNNILISTTPQGEKKLTIIDFNVSKRFTSSEFGNPILMMTNTGTPKYQAPEMLEGKETYYDEKVDTWSAGAVIYYMCTGKHAFPGETCAEIEKSILSGSFNKLDEAYLILRNDLKDLIC
jgi:serine/threonine protein kinase